MESDRVLTIETKEIVISDELKRKVEMVCRFTNTKATIHNGSIRSIKKTNVAYVEAHRIVINNITYLMFDESDNVFVNDLYTKISFKDLENYIKSNKPLEEN